MSETLTFTLIGGSGGDAGDDYYTGGNGIKTIATLTIASGTILYLAVGGSGGAARYNGGGEGFGAGGGATHVALQTGQLASIGEANKSNVLIVAAGGGGGGSVGDGGDGGGDRGGDGSGPNGGGGGGDRGGGDRGGWDAGVGGFGVGGFYNYDDDDGGGGGGGYYGGGGGSGGGGGGGSSFITSNYNVTNTSYENVTEEPSIKIVDSSGLETVFSYTGGIQTYVVPSYASEPAPDVGASPDLPAEPAEKDNFRYNIIPSQKNSYGLRLLYNNLTYSLTNQPKGTGIANTSLGKRATRRR